MRVRRTMKVIQGVLAGLAGAVVGFGLSATEWRKADVVDVPGRQGTAPPKGKGLLEMRSRISVYGERPGPRTAESEPQETIVSVIGFGAEVEDATDRDRGRPLCSPGSRRIRPGAASY